MTGISTLIELRSEYKVAVEHLLAGLKRAQKAYRAYYNDPSLCAFVPYSDCDKNILLDDIPNHMFDCVAVVGFYISFDQNVKRPACLVSAMFGRSSIKLGDKEFPFSDPSAIEEGAYQDAIDGTVIQALDLELADRRYKEYLDTDRVARLEQNDTSKNDISFHEYYVRVDKNKQ